MCAPDPNAGIRHQARIEKRRKDSQYHRASLNYFNKESSWKRGRERILGQGMSRATSDKYSMALYAVGEQRKKYVENRLAESQLSKVSMKSNESVSTMYNKGLLRELQHKQGEVEAAVKNELGAKWDGQEQLLRRQSRRMLAKNRENVGVRPEYGFPVHMPPKGDTTMANIQMGLSIAGTIASFAAMSDRRLKENIEEVGKSPIGYKIYEWNYKATPNTRYRGVIAQDVMKINPMAVDIMPNGYLGVYYDKVDVDMEVVS